MLMDDYPPLLKDDDPPLLEDDTQLLKKVKVYLGSPGMATMEQAAGRILTSKAWKMSQQPNAAAGLAENILRGGVMVTDDLKTDSSVSPGWGQDQFLHKWEIDDSPAPDDAVDSKDAITFLAPIDKSFGQNASSTNTQKACQVIRL